MDIPQLFSGQSVVYNVATMAIESDLDLMLRVRDGDAASFEMLLRRYRLPLVSYFCRMVRDQGLAEDLAQEVFLRVYTSRERYQPEARFTTWLYRIATNLALNAIRDRKETVSDNADDDSDGGPATERFVDPHPSVEQRILTGGARTHDSPSRRSAAAKPAYGRDPAQIPGSGLSADCRNSERLGKRRKIVALSSLRNLARALGAPAPGRSDMKCLEREKLIGYAYRLMDESAASEVRAHLGECSQCRENVAQYGRLDAAAG